MNALELVCGPASGDRGGSDDTAMRPNPENQGEFGDWSDMQTCPSGKFLRAFTIQVERANISDFSAMNGIEMFCGSPQEIDRSNSLKAEGYYGKWDNPTGTCPNGMAMVGLKVKVQPYDKNVDNTAMQDAQFLCGAMGNR